MVDVLPRKLGHVDEPVHAAEVDERTEVHDARHHTRAHLARLQVGEEVFALFLLRLLEPRSTREHDVVAVLVELDDLGFEAATDVRRKVAHSTELDERCGQEAAQTDVEDESALDDLDHRAADDAVLFLDLFDRSPGPLVLRPLLGEDEASFLVFLLKDERFDLVAEADDLGRVDVVADRQLARRDDAFGLVTDVEQHFVAIDFDDRAFDDLAVFDLDHRGGVRLFERHPPRSSSTTCRGTYAGSLCSGASVVTLAFGRGFCGRNISGRVGGLVGQGMSLLVTGRLPARFERPKKVPPAASQAFRPTISSSGVSIVGGWRWYRPGSTDHTASTCRPARSQSSWSSRAV